MEHKQFYEILPDGRYRFRVDHHTINDFNTCERYFNFRHVPDSSGLVWGSRARSFKIEVGSWWSDVMESFYHEMSFGTLPSDHHMLKFASEHWKNLKMEEYATLDPEKFEAFGGLPGAQLMASEYYEAFAKAHYNQWTIVGAELGFGWKDEVPLGEDDKVVVYYGGKPDLVIVDKAQNMIMPLDFKTKDRVPGNASVMWKPHPQTAGYIYAVTKMLQQVQNGQVMPIKPEGGILIESNLPKAPTKCVIMVCARLRPSDKPRSGIRQPRFMPVYPNYAADEIEEWRLSVIEKCRRLRDSIERGIWTPRESACHLFYHGCAFRRVCSTPANARNFILAADFAKVEPWQPYEVDED